MTLEAGRASSLTAASLQPPPEQQYLHACIGETGECAQHVCLRGDEHLVALDAQLREGRRRKVS